MLAIILHGFHTSGSLFWIIVFIALLIGALYLALLICMAIVMGVKYMVVELYEGIKFTIEYWRDKKGRKAGLYRFWG